MEDQRLKQKCRYCDQDTGPATPLALEIYAHAVADAHASYPGPLYTVDFWCCGPVHLHLEVFVWPRSVSAQIRVQSASPR